MMQLGDDGTLDTVIVCSDCGEEFRFNYDGESDVTAGDSGPSTLSSPGPVPMPLPTPANPGHPSHPPPKDPTMTTTDHDRISILDDREETTATDLSDLIGYEVEAPSDLTSAIEGASWRALRSLGAV